jgi:hypothetical protein
MAMVSARRAPVIDDAAAIRELLSRVFTREGYDVQMAAYRRGTPLSDVTAMRVRRTCASRNWEFATHRNGYAVPRTPIRRRRYLPRC